MTVHVDTGFCWRKSSYSTSEGENCVEVGWRKSSYSNPEGPDCVEVAHREEAVAVRDSKNPDGGHLTLTPATFRSLVANIVQTAD